MPRRQRKCQHCGKSLASDAHRNTRYHDGIGRYPNCKRIVELETKRNTWHKYKGDYRP